MKIMTSGKIKNLELKNKILMAPMGTHMANFGRETAEYLVRRAEGGAAMIIINMMVTDYFEDASASLLLNEDSVRMFREICERSHALGCKICAQLMPGTGRMAGPAKMYPVPISASACSWLHAPDVPCHELTLEEIEILKDGFRKTAELAVGAGADAIEIHAYGGYLGDQFLTAAWNTRDDRYGGDVKGRATFILELMEISREAGGADFPVIIKYCPDHYLPYPGFRAIEEGIELADIFEEAGASALHIDAGCYENWHLSMPAVYYQEQAPQIKSAKIISKNVCIPVITHGRLGDVEKAEAVLQTGAADFVVIGRGLLADPDLPNKVSEGKTDDILPCISCNDGCIGNVLKQKHIACTVNPYTGFETERSIAPAEKSRKVLIVGGGPGGCAAALMAKDAGHQVEIWEKTSQLGGKALVASKPYMKLDMHSLITYYGLQLAKRGIPVRYCTEATWANVKKHAPGVLIWAAGGVPCMPGSIKGLDHKKVTTCDAYLKNLAVVGDKVIVVGGGLVGVETALDLERRGRKVTLIEMCDRLLPDPPFAQNEAWLREKLAAGTVEVYCGTTLAEVDDRGVLVRDCDGERSIACDTVLMAAGYLPSSKLAESLEDICPVHVIGDAEKARNIMCAIEDAYFAVSKL